MAGLVGCVFYLIVECTCFGLQTDQVDLFLAAALFFILFYLFIYLFLIYLFLYLFFC